MALPSATRRFLYLLIADGKDGHTLHNIDTRPLFAPGVALPQGVAHPPAAARGALRLRVRPPVPAPRPRRVEDRRRRQAPPHRHLQDAHGDRAHRARGNGGLRGSASLWSLLPSPPFSNHSFPPSTIASFADAGAGEIIRVSTSGKRTYAFDAARVAWRKEGDWAMPFSGRAQYVADYGLWFGFSGEGNSSDICAADLAAGARPEARHVWADVDGLTGHGGGGWLDHWHLSYMGRGRFCVTKFFTGSDSNRRAFKMAVVTAVEATRAPGAAGEMRMVRRASRCYCYHFPTHTSFCWAY
ncbi:unnamed protein product [Urochloa decumbens]|uniref:Uncharacterized protein n=1 Tax=Urochloa decumbens TaxID=240449 RepID=A0ABC9G3Q6_9POAL